MNTWVLRSFGEESDANLDLVVEALGDHGFASRPLLFDRAETEGSLDGDHLRTRGLFAHTPEPLIEAWLCAQFIRSHTDAGDTIIVSDAGGLGGVLALVESMAPRSARRTVWTVAGSGLWLSTMLTVGTTDHLDMPDASTIDWELVQYRHSAEVLTSSEAAVDLLATIGVPAGVAVGEYPRVDRSTEPGGSVWVSGPVSRRSRTGDILRGLADAEQHVVVSDVDEADGVWEGSAWDALRGIRSILGPRLSRSGAPPQDARTVVIGDALRPPDPAVVDLRGAGARVLAVEGAVAASMWADAETWAESDELAELVAGGSTLRPRGADRWRGPSDTEAHDPGRASRVSVGVPVFGPPMHLRDCVASILDQTVAPHEVLLIDDGSSLEEIDEAMDELVHMGDGLVRALRQPNRGVCVARNRMMSEMDGDSFLLVDQDDVLHPRMIEKTRDAMRSDRAVSAVAVWTEFFGEYNAIEAKPPFDRRVGLRENPIVSTAALIDMTVRDRGIRFAPDLAFLYCEDWHLWSQIVADGGRFGLVPEPLVRHRVHRSSGGFLRTELAHRVGRARATEPLTRRR